MKPWSAEPPTNCGVVTSVDSQIDGIKTRRIGKKLTPGHVALKMGIASTLVCGWETGESRPNEGQTKLLAKIFGVEPPPQ